MKSRFIPFLLLSLILGCSARSKQAEAEAVVAKVEQFHVSKKRLPKTLSEIGINKTEEGPIYYKQIADTRYQVWYGSSLGESVTYDSDRKTWE
jgi:hypothetical protein